MWSAMHLQFWMYDNWNISDLYFPPWFNMIFNKMINVQLN